MSYEKQNFVDGQVLTAAHMNHIEDGIVSAESGSTAYVDQKVGEEAQARTTAIGAAIAQEVADRNQAIDVERHNREQQCQYIQNTSVPSQINAAISDEVDDRNTAISTAISQEVQNRNQAISQASDNLEAAFNDAIAQEASDRDDADKIIDGDIETLKNAVGMVVSEQRTVNLFNYKTILIGKGIHTSTGKPGTNESFDCSDFIPVDGMAGKQLKAGAYISGVWEYECVSSSSWAFYGEDQVMLPGQSGATGLNTGVTVPAGARYFRFSIRLVYQTEPYLIIPYFVVLSDKDYFPAEYVPYRTYEPAQFLIDLDDKKLDKADSYPAIATGAAEQLLSKTGTVNPTPYSYRQNMSGSEWTTVQQITGGTVAWNQIQPNSTSRTNNGVTYTYANGALTVSGMATANSTWLASTASKVQIVAGRKYLCSAGNPSYVYPSVADSGIQFYLGNITNGKLLANDSILTFNESSDMYLQCRVPNGIAGSGTYYPQIFDLTQMFGSAVADYIYGLETATPGAGVALFRQMFPDSYYPYNAGELLSVKTSGRASGGHTYPLDSDLELRGVPVLSNGVPAYDGDQYAPDGTVTRRYGIVDLGTVIWTRTSSSGVNRFQAGSTTGVTGFKVNSANFLLSDGKYIHGSTADGDKRVTIGQALYIRDDAYETEASFKAAMSGTYLVYELRDTYQTTETAAPYQSIQIAGSTEEFVDERTIAVPVGSQSLYQTNLREGLEGLLGTLQGSDPVHAESIAPVQDGTASTNISAGELLMRDGALYKASQAIVAGADIVPGTNVMASSVSDQLTPTAGTITYTTNNYVNSSLASSSWVKCFPFGLAFLRLFVPITSALPTDGTKVATGTVSPAPAYAVYIPTACNSADGLGQIEVEITTAGVINVYTRGISKPSSGWGSYNILIPYICNPI